MEKSRVAAVIIAAGYSSRMGDFKPLMAIRGKAVIGRITRAFKYAGIDDIFVVGGFRGNELKESLPSFARFVLNPDFDEGMFTSIRKGAEAVKDLDIDGFLLAPVDTPLLTDHVISEVLECDPGDFAVPTYLGKKGHPLYIPKKYIEEIINHDGTDGLKGVTEKYADTFQRIETGDISCVLDMDTPDDFKVIDEFWMNYFGKGRRFDIFEELGRLSKGRKIILIRHGEPMQHDGGKIFLGQTDVPLSERGRKQAEAIKADVQAGKIYASSLKRAMETAEIAFPGREIIPVDEFKEMNLGPWDGRYIDEIKEEYPLEYERRGRDIFTFKIGNRAENFYDLQYRVLMKLRDILRSDDGDEIVIVSHSGVIRCIENGLAGKMVDEPWKRPETGEVRRVIL